MPVLKVQNGVAVWQPFGDHNKSTFHSRAAVDDYNAMAGPSQQIELDESDESLPDTFQSPAEAQHLPRPVQHETHSESVAKKKGKKK